MTEVAPFAAPTQSPVDLLIIAGEHSGDENAARMLRKLLRDRPGLNVAALGGRELQAAGAQLLFDTTAVSAIGFVEAAKNLGFFRSLFVEILRWLARYSPRAVCFVDSSGLNLRIAQRMFEQGLSVKGGGRIKTLYYIGPQIWASRPARRFKMAQYLDALAVIFPFEIAAYADTHLPVEFVGHPLIEAEAPRPVRYDSTGPVLLLPGSRRAAVARMFPVMLQAYRRLEARRAVVVYPSEAIADVLRAARPPAGVTLVQGGQPVEAAAVLTSSGTMSLHCALAGVPGVVMYRAHPVEYLLGRLLVTVPYLGIANLLLEKPVYPEYIQAAATPVVLARELAASLADPARRANMELRALQIRALLSGAPGGGAADWLRRQLD